MHRIHIYGNPSVPTTTDLICDAFTQTAYKYGKAFKEMGHYVIMYGTEEFASEFICDKFIPINSLEDFSKMSVSFSFSGMPVSFRNVDINKQKLIEKYSRGSYLSNMIDKVEWEEKLKIIETSRNNLLLSLNENTIKKNDIFIFFWDMHNKDTYLKVETLGGIVIEGLCQYGTPYQTCRFNRAVFASFSELHKRHKIQQFYSKHHTVIPPFFDSKEFTYSDVKQNVYLYLGRIQEYKGFGIIIQLAKKFPDKTFWVAGEARTLVENGRNYLEYQKYDQKMEWLDLTEIPNLIYKGLADRYLRRQLLSQASVLIQPSMYDEPFGWNIIEANLSGTPVVTSNRGAFLDTVKEDVNGYRIDPTSSWEDWRLVLEKAEKLSSLECYNLSTKTYSIERIMSLYIKYIENIIQDKGDLFNIV